MIRLNLGKLLIGSKMKVYYEKATPTAIEVLADILATSIKYRVITGNTPNKLVLTREEYKIIYDYLNQSDHFGLTKEGLHYEFLCKSRIYGMEVQREQ